ncbi:MAG TPA: alanine racemase [Verrucomicrobiae bacterium]|nr:alanine racemase [Verrucomicrobiae bacterium]
MTLSATPPPRPAWVEIDRAQFRRNLELIHADKPPGVKVLSVVKDNAFGHGAVELSRIALETGVVHLAVVTLAEALELRGAGITAPILLLGNRQLEELPWCVEHDLSCAVQDEENILALARIATRANRRAAVHLKVNTGMNRFGRHWLEATSLAELIHQQPSLELAGVMSHFAMSDESDKTFANLQIERFREVQTALEARGIRPRYYHLCNSGGLLDLPHAHFDLVRVGLLPLGVFPSKVCRRIAGIAPVMAVKTRLAAVQDIGVGDTVGYGLRYKAESPRRIGVLPVGYGDGFPRIRNQGHVLVRGHRAPLVGTVAMDAFMVDITDVPGAKIWDEVVLQGRQGDEEITAHDLAAWKGSVSYDILTSWRERLPRVYLPG